MHAAVCEWESFIICYSLLCFVVFLSQFLVAVLFLFSLVLYIFTYYVYSMLDYHIILLLCYVCTLFNVPPLT